MKWFKQDDNYSDAQAHIARRLSEVEHSCKEAANDCTKGIDLQIASIHDRLNESLYDDRLINPHEFGIIIKNGIGIRDPKMLFSYKKLNDQLAEIYKVQNNIIKQLKKLKKKGKKSCQQK